jgi:hypothetical protein
MRRLFKRLAGIKRLAARPAIANIFMLLFIVLTSIGMFIIYTPLGFVTAGVACGIFGFLLGLE